MKLAVQLPHLCPLCGEPMTLGYPLLGGITLDFYPELDECHWLCACGNREPAGYFSLGQVVEINTVIQKLAED